MTIEIDIQVHGLDILIEKYQRADQKASTGLKRAVRRSLEHLRKKVSVYPSQSRKPMQYASFKQMVYVLWAIRKGVIDVPYKRGSPKSGKLGQRWAIKVEEPEGGVIGRLGNITPYAQLVQDKQMQAGYHKGNWPTLQDVFEQEKRAMLDMFYDEIRGLVE